MTDMPEKIYIETIYNNTPCGCSIEKTEEETGVSQTEYTLSSLCVPRSEYEELKELTVALADELRRSIKTIDIYQSHYQNTLGTKIVFDARKLLLRFLNIFDRKK